MATKRKHPVADLTFNAPKLDEVPSSQEEPQRKPAPKPPTTEETRASNVTLPISMWEWIDAKHAEARTGGGKPLRKSAIIRAVFAVAMEVKVDLAGVQTEEEIAQRLIRAIRQ
jgi:hypothetical protein